MIEKKKTIEIKCIKQAFNGNGIVKYNNKEYTIPGILKDEIGLFSLDKKNLKCSITLESIVAKSPNRVNPFCYNHDICGGCQYQHMSYPYELEVKQMYLEDIFKNFKDIKIPKITAMPSPNYYRGKCQMTYKMSKSKRVVCGFYEEGTHNLVPVTDCKIQAKKGTEVINALNEVLTKNKIEPYNEKTKKGVIRHVLLRYGYNSKEILLCLVTNGEFFPGRKNVVNDLIKKDLGITTIVQNYNSRDTSIVLGDRERVLYGKGYIYDTIGTKKFYISAKSFYQVNPIGMQILYKKAIEMAKIQKNEIVLDTYCGVGTIGILASDFAKQVYGVELNQDAYKDAIQNAKLNNIKNISFYNDDSTKFMKNLAQSKEHIDVLIMDPPRDGSTKEFIESIGSLKPKRIIYVSCDPKTLERDLYQISRVGYHLDALEGVDMFPRTFNLECVCQLVLKDKAKYGSNKLHKMI